MPYEQRPNSGQLFKNRDRKNDKAPNLKGAGLLELEDGSLVELDIGGWTRESEKAGKWISLSIKLKGAARQSAANGASQPQQAADDDIPFIVEHDVSIERHFPRA